MDLKVLDSLLVAPLAPLAGVLLFWFIQIVFIDSLKFGLRKIWENHRSFCRFTNFAALFFQAVSHAMGYTLAGIGVSEFKISVSNAKVSPKKERIGFPMWFANFFLSVAPFFLPPFIIFLLLFLVPGMYDFSVTEGYTFSTSLISFGSILQQFGFKFLVFLINLDLLNPFHIIFLVIFLIVGFGIRPSYIGEEDKKVDIFHDLTRIKNALLSHPIYIVFIFLFFYAIYYTSFFTKIPFYILIFSFFGWLSIISIISLLLSHFIVIAIYISDNLPSLKKFLPPMIFVVSYIFLRVFFIYFQSEFALFISNTVSFSLTFFFSMMVFKMERNKLKTKKEIAETEGNDEN